MTVGSHSIGEELTVCLGSWKTYEDSFEVLRGTEQCVQLKETNDKYKGYEGQAGHAGGEYGNRCLQKFLRLDKC